MPPTKRKTRKPFDPKVFLSKTNGGRTISTYQKNEVVFAQGDQSDSVFYILTGKVKMTVLSEQGKEAVVAILGPEEFCGEGCLTGQPLRVATAVAMTECKIMKLDKSEVIRVVHDEPAFSEMFIAHLLARTVRVEADLVDQLSIPARSDWRGLFSCWLILARKADPSRSPRKSAKRCSRR